MLRGRSRAPRRGRGGMKPPATYAPPTVSALVSARRGSGFSRPSSKRIMKSTHASGRSLSAATRSALSPRPRARTSGGCGSPRPPRRRAWRPSRPARALDGVVLGVAPGRQVRAGRARRPGDAARGRRPHVGAQGGGALAGASPIPPRLVGHVPGPAAAPARGRPPRVTHRKRWLRQVPGGEPTASPWTSPTSEGT